MGCSSGRLPGTYVPGKEAEYLFNRHLVDTRRLPGTYVPGKEAEYRLAVIGGLMATVGWLFDGMAE